ncbi:MAG: protein kinase [Myxococcales bacterium]|nr:protein kinase [Myxococcales bacterium]
MVADSAHSSTATGPTTGEYQTLQELAAGGMGSVFLARAIRGPHQGKLVALKRMHPHLERNPQFATGFFDEAWITAGLKHPNIVDTYDWGTDREGRYIALEFVAGDSALNLLKAVRGRGQQMPIDVVLFIVGKTAEALHAAHELRNERGELRHLVHRDVTPSNVLISRDGQVKLIDFGVAKARERLQNNTTTNTLKGKFGYMSPEQARGVKNLDRRSDLWSLGVVLWECLAGRRLFKSESELEILRMVTEDTPASVRSVRPEVPEAVDQLLSAVFAKNRDDRLGSCAEFADYLWAVFREEGYTTDEKKLAAYFRAALPERCAALDRLSAGEDWVLEPTSAGPSSGSFNGTDAQSGIAMMQARPMLSTGSFSGVPSAPGMSATGSQVHPAMSSQVIYPASAVTAAPVAVEQPKNKNGLIVVGALAIALVSLGGAAVVVMQSRNASTPTATIAQGTPTQTPATNTATPATPTNTQQPTNVAPGEPQPNPAQTNNAIARPATNTGSTASGRAPSRTRPGTRQTTTGATTVTPEQTQQAMLRPTATPNPQGSSEPERPTTPTQRDPAPTRPDPPVVRPTNPTQSNPTTNQGTTAPATGGSVWQTRRQF